MSEWKSLSSITSKIGSGSTPRGGNSVYSDSGISFIRSQNVLDMDFSTENLAFINDSQAEKLNNVIVEKNDILLNITGDSIARCTVVPEEILPARVNQHVSIIRCKNTEESKYVMYYLQYMKKYLLQISKVGGTRNALTKEAIGKLPIKISDDCNKISKILDNIDQKIQTNNQINQELEAMAKILYDYWFVQFDFPDQNGKPYKSSGGKMVYNPELKRQIPEGWGVASLFDVAEVQYGYPFSTDYFNSTGDGVPVIRIRDILGNDITNYSTEEVEDKYKINVGDVLIGMDGNFHMNYWIQEDCYLNQRVVKVNSDKLPNMVLKYQIEPFIKLREKSVSRTTVGHLSDKDLKAINVILPKEKYLSPIFERFENILKNIIINQQQNQQLIQLRDWLLPMLMNGQVKVEKRE